MHGISPPTLLQAAPHTHTPVMYSCSVRFNPSALAAATTGAAMKANS
jgi:hypothetical protein